MVADPATGQQALAHHHVEIAADLGDRGELVQTLVDTEGVFAVDAQRQRVHAVKRRGLVQGNEGVDIVPVATRLTVAVDDGDPGIGFLQQGVCKGQADSTAADDQVVGVQGIQANLQLSAMAR